jgi:hypothetical protein
MKPADSSGAKMKRVGRAGLLRQSLAELHRSLTMTRRRELDKD